MRFYKRDPNAALSGMAALTMKQRGAYNSLIDLLYATDGDVPDDDRIVAKQISCHWREWGALKRQLIDAGKVRVEGGKLTARRVHETLKEASETSQRQRKRAAERWQTEGVNSKNTNKNNGDPMQPRNAINSKSQSHSQSQTDSQASKVTEDAGRAARLSKALRLDPGDWNRYRRLIEQMVDFQQKGFDLDADVIPCIEQMVADGRVPQDVRSLAYFDKPVRAFVEARAIAAEAERLLAAEEIEKVNAMTPAQWETHVWWWLFCGEWAKKLGAPPLQPGCRAPIEARKVREVFQKLGEKPYAKFRADGERLQPIDWPDGAWARIGTSPLELDDMHRFLDGGEDVRATWVEIQKAAL